MKTVKLMIGFILGLLFSYLAVSIISSAPDPLYYIDIITTVFFLGLGIVIFYSGTSSKQQCVYMFAIAGAVFVLLGLLQISVSSSATEAMQTAAAQMPGSTSDNLKMLNATQTSLKSSGIYSGAFGTLFFLIALAFHWASKRRVNEQPFSKT